MSLNFPNPSRSYDSKHAWVRFWGHDSAIEVAFSLEEDALFLMAPQTEAGEAGILHSFDANRGRIMDVARKAYAAGRHDFYVLAAADFSK